MGPEAYQKHFFAAQAPNPASTKNTRVNPLCVANSATLISAPLLMAANSILSNPKPADAEKIAANDAHKKADVFSVARKGRSMRKQRKNSWPLRFSKTNVSNTRSSVNPASQPSNRRNECDILKEYVEKGKLKIAPPIGSTDTGLGQLRTCVTKDARPLIDSPSQFTTREEYRPDTLNRFEHWWAVPVQFVLFLFGFANAGVPFAEIGPGTYYVLAGLLLGNGSIRTAPR